MVGPTEHSSNDSDQSPIDELSRTLKEKLWKDHIKAFLDFRSFLSQRRVLMKHPSGAYPVDAVIASDWRSPFAFALQATLLIGVVAGVISKAFEAVVKPRPVTVMEVVFDGTSVEFHPRLVEGGGTWETRLSILETYRERTAHLLDEIRSSAPTDSFSPPIPYSEAYNPTLLILSVSINGNRMITRDQAVPLFDAELAALDRQITMAKLTPRVETAYRSLRFVVAGLSLILGAYLFRFLSQIRARKGYEVTECHKQFLYAMPSYLFWPNMVLSVLLVAYAMYEKYFPPGFDEAVHSLDATLRSIDEPYRGFNPLNWSARELLQLAFFCMGVLLVVWSYVQVRGAARWLATTLRLPSAYQSGFYRGLGKIRKDLLMAWGFSSGFIGILAALLALTIGVVGLWLSMHRI